MVAAVSSLFQFMEVAGILTDELEIVVKAEFGAAAANSGGMVQSAAAARTLVEGPLLGTWYHRNPDVLRPSWRVGDTVSMRMPLAEVAHLAAIDGVQTLRPARIHTTQLIDVAALHAVVEAGGGPGGCPTGKGVTIAILDSGIDTSHPDFAGRIDARSRSFVPNTEPHDIQDANGHGTHVAGIIAGAGARFRGIAPDSRILVLRVFDAAGEASEGVVAEALDYAAEAGVDIINYSGGTAPVRNRILFVKPPWVWKADEFKEERAIRRAAEKGVLSVIAAGNYGTLGPGTITNPAISPHCLAIGSVSKAGAPSSFSSSGPVRRSNNMNEADFIMPLSQIGGRPASRRKPDLVAAGGELAADGPCVYLNGVVSALGNGTVRNPGCDIDERYTKMAGTSQAAPVAAALAALVMERLAGSSLGPLVARRPTTRLRIVKGVLKRSCVPIVGSATLRVGRGFPRWAEIEDTIQQLEGGKISPSTIR